MVFAKWSQLNSDKLDPQIQEGGSRCVNTGIQWFQKALQPQLHMDQFQVLLTTYEYIIREKAALTNAKNTPKPELLKVM